MKRMLIFDKDGDLIRSEKREDSDFDFIESQVDAVCDMLEVHKHQCDFFLLNDPEDQKITEFETVRGNGKQPKWNGTAMENQEKNDWKQKHKDKYKEKTKGEE